MSEKVTTLCGVRVDEIARKLQPDDVAALIEALGTVGAHDYTGPGPFASHAACANWWREELRRRQQVAARALLAAGKAAGVPGC